MEVDSERQKESKAKSMNRSQSQLAGSYAPGVFFPFEGGLGACMALPLPQTHYNLYEPTPSVRAQISLRLDEAIQSWVRRAQTASDSVPMASMCVSDWILNQGQLGKVTLDRFMLVKPVNMGYTLAPLTFVCEHEGCGLYRGFDTVKQTRKEMENLIQCPNCHRPARWRQLDVIHVHPSGHWEPLRPGRYDWRVGEDGQGYLQRPRSYCAQCSNDSFRLVMDPRGLSHWRFVCANCNTPDFAQMRQNDPVTLESLKDQVQSRPGYARMEAISYRASAAHYAQSDQFVLFGRDNPEIMSLLDQSRESDLVHFIATQFGFGHGERPTFEELALALRERGFAQDADTLEGEAKRFTDARDALALVPETIRPVLQVSVDEQADKLRISMDTLLNQHPDLFPEQHALSAEAEAVFAQRAKFSMRFDPFRLAVEHEALEVSVLRHPGKAGRRPYVSFAAPDADLAPRDPDARADQIECIKALLPRLGLVDCGLIREFNLCRMTFGFTRVGNQPILERDRFGPGGMPVKLNLFPLEKNIKGRFRSPIYIIDQTNEAYYFRLKPSLVYDWLQAINPTPADSFAWSPSDTIRFGGRLLENAVPFGRFLDNIGAEQMSQVYPLVYGLLHSYAHVLMKVVAERSGLDLGSMGEYIFPADLAFVIYRNGTTLDLGNLSSVWRNDNKDILKELLASHTTECGAGSLCDEGGGACPDCLMIPETACLAQNRLLSRAYLCGGPVPWQISAQDEMPGYLEIAHAAVAKTRSVA
ncbi:hypothetical protein PVT67_00585 [Gallaecimonas kandeliae]|uniref:hypothetical protein n=1 Tax=Gallaecimonas kandeliae TaxID=3029055 RepID=UPI002649C1B0|nr:hypothetical protein [Gallaecimonas kandeliae]WKE65786.1 hypothetical protein PVT67_00585 [Gallaecimonas kandeliae]